MFKRSTDRVNKLYKPKKPSRHSFRDDAKQQLRSQIKAANGPPSVASSPRPLSASIVTMTCGPDQRLFACHEDILMRSPFFAAMAKNNFFGSDSPRLALTDEEPEILSLILEYLYRGDYSPKLLHDKKRNTWVLDDNDELYPTKPDGRHLGMESATVFCRKIGDTVLRDTAVYCAAERYGLEELKRIALRKQGLQSGIDVATILRSARYAYDNTPESDSRLRAHYLALIIRSRKTFKRSGTMQMEMELGGKMMFDLFVAMCNHVDDLSDTGAISTLRTV